MMERAHQHSVALGAASLDGTRPAPLAELLSSIAAAKGLAAELYEACLAQAPDAENHKRQATVVKEERALAQRLRTVIGVGASGLGLGATAPPAANGWPSGLMLAFALDQATTAALVGVARADNMELVSLAASGVDEERRHQEFVLSALEAATRDEPALGQRLAREMIEARDWVKAIFPRHAILAALAETGALAADAARVHDSFLASLGDRIQEALGVLGDF